jgi:hypothetical protein
MSYRRRYDEGRRRAADLAVRSSSRGKRKLRKRLGLCPFSYSSEGGWASCRPTAFVSPKLPPTYTPYTTRHAFLLLLVVFPPGSLPPTHQITPHSNSYSSIHHSIHPHHSTLAPPTQTIHFEGPCRTQVETRTCWRVCYRGTNSGQRGGGGGRRRRRRND